MAISHSHLNFPVQTLWLAKPSLLPMHYGWEAAIPDLQGLLGPSSGPCTNFLLCMRGACPFGLRAYLHMRGLEGGLLLIACARPPQHSGSTFQNVLDVTLRVHFSQEFSLPLFYHYLRLASWPQE